jgi:hypothetical protein
MEWIPPIKVRQRTVMMLCDDAIFGTYTMLVELKRKNNSTSEARSKREVHPGYFGIPADEQ